MRTFVRITGTEKAPRYLRFLRTIIGPDDNPLARSQQIIMQCISQRREVHALFRDDPERRAELVASNDHAKNPRGELAYHIEFIALLGECPKGQCVAAESLVRDMLPISDLLDNLIQLDLPLSLRANYLRVLDNAYLQSESLSYELQGQQIPAVLAALCAHVRRFREDFLPRWTEFVDDDDLAREAAFIFERVVRSGDAPYSPLAPQSPRVRPARVPRAVTGARRRPLDAPAPPRLRAAAQLRWSSRHTR